MNSTHFNLQTFSLCLKKELLYYELLANYRTSLQAGGIASGPHGGCLRGALVPQNRWGIIPAMGLHMA
jgi:hypothetical protein